MCNKLAPNNIIFQEIKKFATKFGQPFWLKTPYCNKRGENHPNKSCEACESHMMCTFGLHLHKQKKLMDEMICINCVSQTKIQTLETTLQKLAKINESLTERINHGKH